MDKTDKAYEFLTHGASEPIVRGVMLSFRHFIALVLVVVLMGGGVPYLVCTPEACAANTQCASVHCKCCGPSRTGPKSSRESQKHDTHCNQDCPLITAGTVVTTNSGQPLAPAMMGISEVRPFLIAYTAFYAPPVRPPAPVHPSTLLSLACALTI